MTHLSTSKILILGSTGLLGSALVRLFDKKGFSNIFKPSRQELNLFNQQETLDYFFKTKPDYVINAAAKVGGIKANNTQKADFIFENLTIQNNIFEAAFKCQVKRLLFIGSSCMYPREAPQPIREESLLTGPIEKTNEPFAIAKIAGLKMAESFREQYGVEFHTLISNGIYGPGDHFEPENSHVIAGLITRMKEAIDNNSSTFEIWGSGKPRREFLYADDVAHACYLLLTHEGKLPWSYLNVGPEKDISIAELAELIGKIMGFKGKFVFNTNYPDGTLTKSLDTSRIKSLGFKPQTSLEDGLRITIENYYHSV